MTDKCFGPRPKLNNKLGLRAGEGGKWMNLPLPLEWPKYLCRGMVEYWQNHNIRPGKSLKVCGGGSQDYLVEDPKIIWC